MFSKESRQAILNMGNVEFIELKKTTIQCLSCFHYVFEGTFLCKCEKFLQFDPDAVGRIWEAFGSMKAPFRASPLSTRGAKCRPNPWQVHHFKARDAYRGATKGLRGFTSIWDRWHNDAACRQSQLVQNWSDAWVRYLDHIVQLHIFHRCAATATRKKYAHPLLTQCWSTIRGTASFTETREAKEQLRNLQKEQKDNN